MTTPEQPDEQTATPAPSQPRRKRVSQSEVPRHLLRDALRVPEALAENFAKEPARPIDLAVALAMSPTSGGFRSLCGAALGYGLTTGGPNSQAIGLTDLGHRIVSPLREGDDEAAKREAVLTPGVVRRFLERYDGHPLPAENIAHNVLESMDVPRAAAGRVYDIIRQNADEVAFVKLIKEKAYVDLGPVQSPVDAEPEASVRAERDSASTSATSESEAATVAASASSGTPVPPPIRTERVFVSGGAKPELATQIAALLEFGGREAVAKADLEAPDTSHLLALVDEMRECSSGVFFLSARATSEALLPGSRSLSAGALFELGAAVALFGPRCVLVVEAGAEIPPWLSDLPSVTSSGGELTLTDITAIVSALMSANGADE